MTDAPDFPNDEALYRRIVEHSPAAVVLLTNEAAARVLYASPRIEELSGFTPDELVSQPGLWVGRLHPDEGPELGARWTSAVEHRERFSAEYRFLHRSGEWRWFRETSSPVRGTDGAVRYRQSFTEDITSERFAEAQAERSEARYRDLVERLPVIVYVDSDETEPRSLYVSPNSREVLGYEPRDFLADPDLWFASMHPEDLARVRAAWAEAVRERRPFHEEYRDLKPDGTVVWVRDHSLLVHDEEGQPLFWQGVLLDITAERDAEAMLRRSERRRRALVEQVPAAVYEMGPDDERRTLFVSPHIEQILGYTRQEWLDQPDIWTELLHPDDRESELDAHDRHTRTGEPWQREYRLIASDGRQVWIRDQAELVTDEDGVRWLGVMLDISGQKRAEELLRAANDELERRVMARTSELEEANEMMGLEIGERRRVEGELREAEERYRALVERIPGVVYTWRVPAPDDTRHTPINTYTSPRIEDLLGFTVTEWQDDGHLWDRRLHPHDRARVLAAAQRSADTGEQFNEEFRYLAKDGRVVWVLEQATLLRRDDSGAPRYFQGVMLDVTDRRAAQEQATAAEERFRRLTERGPFIVYEYELGHADPPVLHMRFLSPSASELLGIPADRWQGDVEAWLSMMHPDDVERMTTIAHRSLQTGDPWNHIFRMIAGDGRVVWLLDRGRAIEHDELGRPQLFQGILLDVSEEAEVHAALEASEATFRSVVETMPGVPWSEVVDPETGRSRFAFIGPQVEEVFGYSPGELLSEPDHFFRLLHPDDRERAIAARERCDRTGEPWEILYRIVHRDGSIHWLMSHGRRSLEDGRPVWHGLSIDVTRQIEGGTLSRPAYDRGVAEIEPGLA